MMIIMVVVISRWILISRCPLSSWIRSTSKLKFWQIRSFLSSFNLFSKSFHKVVLSWKFEPRARKWVYTERKPMSLLKINKQFQTNSTQRVVLISTVFTHFKCVLWVFFVCLIDPLNVQPVLGSFGQQKVRKTSSEQPLVTFDLHFW